MKDTFDLTKFLKENKSLENLNSTFKSLNENQYYKDAEADDAEHIDALEKDMKDDKESSMKAKIKEMILAELDINDTTDAYANCFEEGKEVEEAKKDKEVEDVEITDVETTDTTEEVPAEDAPIEDVPATGGGLEDIAADMKGTEADLMDHLMKSFQIAKGMQNEKLETQIGNTLKFFVSEYIGGGE
jgi:hypothetical protein